MRTLVLLRHAKAVPQDREGPRDHERPLTERGHSACTLAAQALKDWPWEGTPVRTSSALRAQQTAQDLAAAGLYVWSRLTVHPELYTFSGEELQTLVRDLPDHLPRVAVVGHNPALEMVLTWCLGSPQRMPTLAAAWLELDIESWQDFPQRAQLRAWWQPPR